MKRKWVCRLLGVVFLAAFAVPKGVYAAGESEEALGESVYEADAVIADGVYIDTVEVGGMTAKEASEAVLAHIDEIGKKTLTLTLEGADGIEPIQTSVSELGLHTDEISDVVSEAMALGKDGNLITRYKAEKDLQASHQVFEIGAAVDEEKVKRFVEEKTSGLGAEPVDAEITREGGQFSVSESRTGVKVDVPATVSLVLEAFQDWDKGDLSLEAAAELVQPERSTEFLSQIQDSLGSFTASTSDRGGGKLQNLNRGVELTDGTLIMPGETWSMHDALAPFSASNGYTKQVAYQGGTYAQEYGGGICQLATILYNAALLAEVEITERYNHSLVVYYTDFGLDATINDDGSKDLKLTNNFDFPVYIEGSHDGGGEVTYTVWGKETRPSNRTVRFYGKTLSKVPAGEQIIEDPTKPVGYQDVVQSGSYPAVKAEAYKEVLVDNEVVERILLHTDKYSASPRKVIRGTAVPAPAPDLSGGIIYPDSNIPEPTPEPTPETPEPGFSGGIIYPDSNIPEPTPEPAPEATAPAAG